eukprot:CAMPEP_0172297026 /NCGR_PEP_ID=MMETSP1058-20130122/199_1 /TAXON_ID=83371 /ORGANISM="Detonula confervacea, Strain CCMP 353" /LENGTH=587 /DNA_ID=CAMNT_0013006123 /DNA_START=102 /DNA_END=1862 /DNA_ORIENTATION=-
MASQQPYYNASNSGSSPPVVQGVLVNNPNDDNANNDHVGHTYDHKHANHGVGAMEISSLPPHQSPLTPSTDEGNWTRGSVQPKRCNDFLFAFLFYVNLGVMAWVAAVFAPKMIGEVAESAAAGGGGGRERGLLDEEEVVADGYSDESSVDDATVGVKFASWMVRTMHPVLSTVSSSVYQFNNNDIHDRDLEENDNVTGTNDMSDMMLLLGISALIALVISSGVLSFMIRHAESLIKFALLFNIASAAVFAIGSLFLSPFAAIIGIGFCGLTIYYAYVVWGRIPFAACNLISATTAVRANFGLAFFAYNSLFIMIGWSMWWLLSFTSVVYITSGCDGQGNCEKDPSGWLIFALLLSYYWTFQVIKNVVHVTVAGTVGTWWFVPTEGSSCCSHGVRDSFLRSVTTSFGSICMGSLLVAIIETAKTMVRNLRESEGGGIFLCLAECLLACLQDIMEYFNMWAFVFVGLYGYPYVESGKNVINLFKTRGWTTIITDNLAQSVLTMVSVAVGLITGLVALGIAHGQRMVFGDELGGMAAAFFIGFIIGFVLTSTLMTLVSSAVNTVIVCYAEAPREFEENHPKLSQEMQSAW